MLAIRDSVGVVGAAEDAELAAGSSGGAELATAADGVARAELAAAAGIGRAAAYVRDFDEGAGTGRTAAHPSSVKQHSPAARNPNLKPTHQA